MEDVLELSSLENMKSYLLDERSSLKKRMELLKAELEKLDKSLSTARGYIASYDNREKEHAQNIEKLRTKKEALINQLNESSKILKTIKNDIERSSVIKDALNSELKDVKEHKGISINKMAEINEAIASSKRDRDIKMPEYRNYNESLRRAYRLFKETENRIDLSMKLKARLY